MKGLPKCIHCERTVTHKERRHYYPVSKTHAHFYCVSQPSKQQMDHLIAASQEAATK